MNNPLQRVLDRLAEEKKQRGRLSRIAADTGISYRTIYGMMHAKQNPNAGTIDKLLAYFKKEDRRAERAAK